MLLVIHNLPPSIKYAELKSLIQTKCGLSEVVLDNLVNEGATKRVTVGLADDGDAAILVRKMNGLYLGGQQLYVARQDMKSKQPYKPKQQFHPQNLEEWNSSDYQTDSLRNQALQEPKHLMNFNPVNQDWSSGMQAMSMGQDAMGMGGYNMGMTGMYYMPTMQTMPMTNFMGFGDTSQQVKGVPTPLMPEATQETMGFGFGGNDDMGRRGEGDGNMRGKTRGRSSPSHEPRWNQRRNESQNVTAPFAKYYDDPAPRDNRAAMDNHDEPFRPDRLSRPHHDSAPSFGNQASSRWDGSDQRAPRWEARENTRFDEPRGQPSRFDAPGQQASGFDSRGQTSRFDEPRAQRSRFDAPTGHGSRFDAPRGQTSRFDAPREQGSRFDAPRGQSSRFDAPREQMARFDAPRDHGSRFDNSVEQGPRWEVPSEKPPRWEASNKGSSRPEPVARGTRGGNNPSPWDAPIFRPRQQANTNEPVWEKHSANPPKRSSNDVHAPRNAWNNPTTKRPSHWQDEGPPSKRPPMGPDSGFKGKNNPANPKFDAQNGPKPKQDDNLHKAMCKDETWRGQATSALAKEIVNCKLYKIPLAIQSAILNKMKKSIRSRINLLLGTRLSNSFEEIVDTYRRKFSKGGDFKLLEVVIKEKNDEDAAEAAAKDAEKTDGENKPKPPAQPDSTPKKPTVTPKPKVPTTVTPKPKKPMPTPQKSVPKQQNDHFERLPSYPNADKKALKKLQLEEKINKGNLFKELPAEIKSAVEEEVDVLSDLFMTECMNPVNDQEKAVCEEIADVVSDEFRTVIKEHVAKRIMNMNTNLCVRALAQGRVPPRDLLEAFVRDYGAIALKKSDKGGGKMYIVYVDSFDNYDRLCALNEVSVSGIIIRFKPLHVLGPPLTAKKAREESMARNKRFRKKFIDNTKENILVPGYTLTFPHCPDDITGDNSTADQIKNDQQNDKPNEQNDCVNLTEDNEATVKDGHQECVAENQELDGQTQKDTECIKQNHGDYDESQDVQNEQYDLTVSDEENQEYDQENENQENWQDDEVEYVPNENDDVVAVDDDNVNEDDLEDW